MPMPPAHAALSSWTCRTTSAPAARWRSPTATPSSRSSTALPAVRGRASTPRTGTRTTIAPSPPATRARRPSRRPRCPTAPQVLWPDHCVQGTPGADVPPRARDRRRRPDPPQGLPSATSTATRPSSRTTATTPTGLAGYLRERGVTGLARRPRHRLLRRLFGPRRRRARLRGHGDRGRLPRDRPRRLPPGRARPSMGGAGVSFIRSTEIGARP